MKIGIYYFSGTNNTKWVGENIANYYRSEGHDVHLQSIEETDKPQKADLIVIGGPIYAGNMPEKLIRWVLRNIPKTTSANAIVYSTSTGLLNANGTTSIGKKLIKKGYNLLGALKYQMPRNYYFGKYERQTYEENIYTIKVVKETLTADLVSCNHATRIAIEEKVIGHDLMAELMSVMTKFMGKKYEVSDQCIKCNKCVKGCPTQNIVMKDLPTYELNCMMCTRCLHNCPMNAISYNGKSFEQYNLKEYI